MPPRLIDTHAKTIPQIAEVVFRLSPSESENSTPTITFHKVRAQQPNAPVLGLGLSSYLGSDVLSQRQIEEFGEVVDLLSHAKRPVTAGPWAEDSDQKVESDDPSKTPG